MSVSRFIKKIIKPFLIPLRNVYRNKKSKKYCKLSMNQTCLDKNIIFICQCEYIWNKQRDVFAELIKTNDNVILYVIKDNQSVSQKEITIFEEEFPKYVKKYEEVKLKDLNPGIVMYSRPYPNHLPEEVRIHNVIKYAKTAYIPYYYSLDNLVESGINDYFYKYLTFYYTDQDEVKNHFDELQYKNVKKGYQIAYNYGFPMFEKLYDNVTNSSIFRNDDKFKVMWTPRWTMDEKLGGSNFLKYYKDMFSHFVNNDKFSFVFRPHPLLFGNFIQHGLITLEEKNNILDTISKSKNSFHDTTSDYINTFYHSDVLICDNSSIVVEYFLSGHPIIYCYNDSKIVFNEPMNKILECNYVVTSFDEIISVLEKLMSGIDEKKELRDKYLNEFVLEHQNSAYKISKEITSFFK